MRHTRITIETVHCKRCGREIATASRSIHNLDSLKAKYGNVCQDCTTSEERAEMTTAIAEGILRQARQ